MGIEEIVQNLSEEQKEKVQVVEKEESVLEDVVAQVVIEGNKEKKAEVNRFISREELHGDE